MDKSMRLDSDYMTVGEIAAKAGVTIRAIQYYDQKGLLVPSAKGSRNLRLYTKQDLDRLYRILCYKFLGLSLDEIRQRLGEGEHTDTSRQIKEELQKRIAGEEREISERMKRYALLKDLQNYTECHEVGNWESYAELIDYLQEKWYLIWEINLAYEDGQQLDWNTGAGTKLTAFYKLATEAVRLIREGTSPRSKEAAEIIARYERMSLVEPGGDAAAGFEKKTLLHIDPLVMTTDSADYAAIWEEIKSFLSEAGKYYRESVKGSGAAE